MAIKEAAKQCTKWGLAGGPDAKKPDPAWGGPAGWQSRRPRSGVPNVAWPVGPTLKSPTRRGGTGRMAIKEAAKRCTKCGLAGGPDAKKM
jgi:hypothetical protein